MKCGEIWARSARTSASTSRRRDASSSARSSWPETQAATSSVARTRPAVGSGEADDEVPDDDLVDHQRTEDHVADRAGRGQVAGQVGRADDLGRLGGRRVSSATCSAWCEPRPSQAEHPVGVGQRDGRRARAAPGGVGCCVRRCPRSAPRGGPGSRARPCAASGTSSGRPRCRGGSAGRADPARRPSADANGVLQCATRAQGRTTTSLVFFLGLLPVVFLAVPTSL